MVTLTDGCDDGTCGSVVGRKLPNGTVVCHQCGLVQRGGEL